MAGTGLSEDVEGAHHVKDQLEELEEQYLGAFKARRYPEAIDLLDEMIELLETSSAS